MKKNTYVGVAIVLVVFIGIVLYAATRPVPAKAPGTIATSTLSGSSYAEHTPYYDITANYATSTPLQEPANTAAITLMKNFVGDTITQFKDGGTFVQGRKETFTIVYLIASSPHTVSYIFTIYEDTLGAHGNTFFHTFTFDISTGANLLLADIFLPGTNYLNTLSSLARAKLPAIIGPDADATFIKDGTTPEDKNFANFFFDNNQMVFIFPPYQVGPYTAGTQTLRIPLSELSSILKPEYR